MRTNVHADALEPVALSALPAGVCAVTLVVTSGTIERRI
jgi:hypothetical protein